MDQNPYESPREAESNPPSDKVRFSIVRVGLLLLIVYGVCWIVALIAF
jgi:hypothetical protein